ncbi:hypothetical protein PYW07_007591 [Mythimna separata]|uniref:Uncharacterized protein n=1 Tax=Mythimna separata TaxID=271217 RepID=A0AAD7YNN3_MYTSE|nr:hypothetical protein PYW07_007591 [Mythimna separata]
MSTRSGKRIHTSLLEDTGSTEQDRVLKTDRKTRSKRVKENLDELSVTIFKNKKRNNYVSYPTDDELLGDAAATKEAGTKPSRALRKNALKEHNPVDNSDQERQVEANNLIRKSRRFKKIDDDEETENIINEPAEVTEVPKSKKSKKKMKAEAVIDNPPTEEAHSLVDAPLLEDGPAKDHAVLLGAKKSKKKKKKGKKTSSIIVEDVPQNDNSGNVILNRSNMSVDSFHSAAGSPYKNENKKEQVNKVDNNEEINKPTKTNKKINKKKISNNNTYENNEKAVNMSTGKIDEHKNNNKITKKRKPGTEEMALDQCFVSVARDNLDKGLEDILNVSNGHLKGRKSNTKDATFDKSNISANLEKDMESNLNGSKVSHGLKRRKSNMKEVNEELESEKMSEDVNNVTFDKGLRSSIVKDSTFDKNNASIAMEINEDYNDSNISQRTRRSMIKDSTFDKSNALIAKEIVDNNDDLNISNGLIKHHNTRRSFIKDSTFDKNNTSITKEIAESIVDTELNNSKHFKTRRSMLKDSTFDKSNASIVKEGAAAEIDLNVSPKTSKARKSNVKDSTFDKSSASIVNGNDVEKETEANVNISNNLRRRRKSNIKDTTFDKQETLLNTTFEKEKDKDTIKDSTFNKSTSKCEDTTYEKDVKKDTSPRKSSVNTTYDKTDKAGDTTFDKDISASFDAFKKGANTRKSSIRDSSFNKSNVSITSLCEEDFEKVKNIVSSSATKRWSLRRTIDKNDTIAENVVNTTYEKTENTEEQKRKSPRLSKTSDIQTVLNTTFEKEDANKEKENLISCSNRSSLISSDNSSVTDKNDISRISITSDDTSAENIVNTTPLLIESSMDDSRISINKSVSPKPQTPLKREGTFTKDGPEQNETEAETPSKRQSVPAAGCTPYHVSKSSEKKTLLNVTRSLEKGVRATVDPAPRLTRVMFCSPVDNPVTFTGEKRKVIKSNLKGSNKSFVFDENASILRPGRKRSYTQNDADDARAKRSRLTEDLQHSVERLSRPRTASATGKLSVVTPKKPSTPSKPKSEGKPPRTRLPNFAALHQKQFDRMESLNECQERKAKRARQLLTPTAPPGLLERISPKNNTESPKKIKESAKAKEKIDNPTKKLPALESARPGAKDKTDTPTKKLPTAEASRPGFTRFGFKLNLDVNPFSIPSKAMEKPKVKPVEKPNGIVPRAGILPSLAGATTSRREVAKLAVMREKSFTDRRNLKRNENRTVIKGVRTNRRFELQMKMRNID